MTEGINELELSGLRVGNEFGKHSHSCPYRRQIKRELAVLNFMSIVNIHPKDLKCAQTTLNVFSGEIVFEANKVPKATHCGATFVV